MARLRGKQLIHSKHGNREMKLKSEKEIHAEGYLFSNLCQHPHIKAEAPLPLLRKSTIFPLTGMIKTLNTGVDMVTLTKCSFTKVVVFFKE